MKLTPKVRKTLDIATRLLIAAMSLGYIFYRISWLSHEQVSAFFNVVISGNGLIAILFSLVLLMFVNWGLESLKWKLLIGLSENISFRKSFLAVLGGLAVSIFTPNRTGEFLGRVFILKKTEPLKAILLTIVGSFSQLLVTILVGSLAFLVFAPQYLTPFIPESARYVNWLVASLIGISAMALFLFFNIPALKRLKFTFPTRYSEKITDGIAALSACPRRLLFNTLIISGLRYLVFSLQFYLSLSLMGVQMPLVYALQVIPVIYLVLTAIPTVALSEIGVRGSVSVFIFGLLASQSDFRPDNPLAVVSATTLIWLINIAIPSLAGVLVVFRLKFFRR